MKIEARNYQTIYVNKETSVETTAVNMDEREKLHHSLYPEMSIYTTKKRCVGNHVSYVNTKKEWEALYLFLQSFDEVLITM